MELVYLWVEDYKNIDSQGFNFSPRFECEFFPEYEKDEEENKILKDNCKLEIKKNENNISFFPKNINVTAIVGENGSGKSAILHKLYEQKNTFFVDLTGKVIDDKEITSILIEPDEFNQNSYDFEILNFANKAKNSNFFLHSFLPTTVYWNLLYEYDISDLYHLNFTDLHYTVDDFSYNEFSQDDITTIEELFDTKINDMYQNILLTGDFTNYIYCKYFIQTISQTKKYEIKHDLCITSYNRTEDEIEEYLTEAGDYIRLLINMVVERALYVENFIEEIKEVVSKYNTKLSTIITLLNNLYAISQKDQMNVYTTINNASYEYLNKMFKTKTYNLIHFKFLKKNGKQEIWLKDLSKGEQDFLKLFAIIFYHKNTLKYDFLLVLLDEVMVYWHPRWQREFLKRLLDFYNYTMSELTIQTIITTHSPFLLSDIPKENVIFLEKGQQVYPSIDTFGANIHTLLSHGFFMKDGLMGEYAKEKINTVITYLNQKQLTQQEIDYCEDIISIIGEPILKRQLQKMLDSKRLREVEHIKKQIEELKKQLSEHQHA
jgi:predicted ATP-binding protein involved in virulence